MEKTTMHRNSAYASYHISGTRQTSTRININTITAYSPLLPKDSPENLPQKTRKVSASYRESRIGNITRIPITYPCIINARGGHIFYVEIDGDATHNPSTIMAVVDMMDRYNMGYCSVNHNRNRCMDCGFEDASAHLETCPKCGSTNIDRLQRITGYLVGTTDRWNHAKLAELNDRVRHD